MAVDIEFGIDRRSGTDGRCAAEHRQTRADVHGDGQVTVVRELQIHLFRADNLALLRVEHHPQRADGAQRCAVLQGKDMVARAEKAIGIPRPGRVHERVACMGCAQHGDMHAGERKKQPAREHFLMAAAQTQGVALTALLHGGKERIGTHPAIKVAIRRADAEGFCIGFFHLVSASSGTHDSITQFGFLDKTRTMD